MAAPFRLLVVGSIAIDTLEGPWGAAEDVLGGSALYFTLAASLIEPVGLVAPVGAEDERRVRALLEGRRVDLSGLAALEGPTYRWHSRRLGGRNLELGSRDDIYDVWRPALPPRFAGWAFVGSMRPSLQLAAARGLGRAALLAADAMRSYVRSTPREALEVVSLCDWYFCNVSELRALGGEAAAPERFRSLHGLDGLCVKAGPAGATAYTAAGAVPLPALTTHPVRDTTGAGDALAGGMLARWLSLGGGPEALPDALVHGVACASFAIEEVGLAGIAAATPERLAERVREIWRT